MATSAKLEMTQEEFRAIEARIAELKAENAKLRANGNGAKAFEVKVVRGKKWRDKRGDEVTSDLLEFTGNGRPWSKGPAAIAELVRNKDKVVAALKELGVSV
jgi:hypothetical protein